MNSVCNTNLKSKMKGIKHLLDNDINKEYECIEYVKSTGFTILHQLVILSKEHQIEDVIEEYLIKNIDKIDHKNHQGWTALHLAASNINTRSTFGTVKILIKYGANINAITNYGCTCLFFVARFARSVGVGVASFLINKGAKINIRNAYGYSALHVSVLNVKTTSSLHMVKLLINKKSNVHAKTKQSYSLLHLAILNERISLNLVKLLINNGVKLNVQCSQGNTILHYLAKQNNKNKNIILKELLNAKINIDVQNNKKLTALHMLIKRGDEKYNLQMIKTLVEAGANTNLLTNNESNAMHLAIKYVKNNLKKIIKILIPTVNINAISNDCDTALKLALINNSSNYKVIKLLVQAPTLEINDSNPSYVYLAANIVPINNLDRIIKLLINNKVIIRNHEPLNNYTLKCISNYIICNEKNTECVVCLNIDKIFTCSNSHGICTDCLKHMNKENVYHCPLCNNYIVPRPKLLH